MLLFLPLLPETNIMLLLGTEKCLARSFMTTSLALTSTGGSFTQTLSVVSSIFSTFSVRDFGFTKTLNFICIRYTIRLTLPTRPSISMTLIPCGWEKLLVRIRLIVPTNSSPVPCCSFSTITTHFPRANIPLVGNKLLIGGLYDVLYPSYSDLSG